MRTRTTFLLALMLPASWSCTNTAFSQPMIVGPSEVVNLGGNAFSSSISSNGLEIYYLDGQVNTVVATRTSTSDAFGTSPFVTGDLHPELSRDGLSLYVNQDPGPFGEGDIAILTRASHNETFLQRSKQWLGSQINTSEWERWPALSADGLELYFARSKTYSGPTWEIWVASRRSTMEPWGEAVRLPDSINVGGSGADSPDLSADGLTLFFTSNRSGGYGADDIWASTRKTFADSWSEPINLGPLVNTSGVEWQPDISADGSQLYYSQSFRADGRDFQVLVAPIVNVPEPSGYVMCVVGVIAASRRLTKKCR